MAPRNTFAASRRSHRILKWLQGGEDVRIQDVVDEFDIQYPQARSDLKLLEDLYGLSTYRDGRTKVWSWSELEPEYLDVATVAALELGAVSLDIFRDTPYGEAIQGLADEWRGRIPDDQKPRVEQLSQGVHLRRNWLPTEPDDVLANLEEVLNTLWVTDHRWLFCTYRRSDGELSDYLLLPRRLIWYQGRLWVLALDRDMLKLFDLAGFQRLERYRPEEHGTECLKDASADGGENIEESASSVHPVEYEKEELDDHLDQFDDRPESYFEDAFGIYAQNYETESIHLQVRGSWRNYLSRYRLHSSQRNEPAEDSLHVHLEMGICPEFESFVLGMIPDVHVHEPVRLREKLQDRALEWVNGD